MSRKQGKIRYDTYRFQYVSNFTTASCGFRATARLSYFDILLHGVHRGDRVYMHKETDLQSC